MGFISDSEIWSVTLSRLLFEGATQEAALYYKPVFHFVINMVDGFTETNVEYFIFTRFLFAIIGCGTLFLTYKIAYQVSRSRTSAATATLLLLFSTLFMVRGYRIRSDLLAIFCHLFVVYRLLTLYRRPHKRYLDRISLFVVTALMFLTTPKSLYFYISQLILGFSIVQYQIGETRKHIFKTVIVSQVGFISLGLGVPFIVEFLSYLIPGIPSASLIYYKAFDFFAASFNPNYGSPEYFSKTAFSYIILFVLRNIATATLIYLGFFFLLLKLVFKKKSIKPNSQKQAFGYYAAFIFLFLIIHNDRLPFFVASMLPPLIILGTLAINDISKICSSFIKKAPTKSYFAFRFTLSIVFIFLAASQSIEYVRNFALQNRSVKQTIAMKYMENYFTQTNNPSYYDVIGTLPKRNTVYAFAGPGEIKNIRTVKTTLNKQDPKVIMYSNKMYLIEPFLTDRLIEYRAPVGFGIFAPTVRYEKELNNNLFPNVSTYKGQVYREFPVALLSYILEVNQPELFSDQRFLTIFKSERAHHPSVEIEDPIFVKWRDGHISYYNHKIPFKYFEENAETFLILDRFNTHFFTLYPLVRLPFAQNDFYMKIFKFDVNY